MIKFEDAAKAEALIGYVFTDKSLLECALTHSSYVNECGGQSNERLEYLGDSILNFIVAEMLFNATPDDEGVLTELRKELVSKSPLAAAVREMGLIKYYRMGKGAKSEFNKAKDKPVSNIFEAVLGAVYLDGGMDEAKSFVKRNLLDKV